MPEPTAVELGREAEQEAAVFAQAMNVEKLLNMLRSFDPATDNLADNEEIQVWSAQGCGQVSDVFIGVVSFVYGVAAQDCQVD